MPQIKRKKVGKKTTLASSAILPNMPPIPNVPPRKRRKPPMTEILANTEPNLNQFFLIALSLHDAIFDPLYLGKV